MAKIDLSRVIKNPMLSSEVTLISRQQQFDVNGNPFYVDDECETVQAIVTSDARTIQRLSDDLQHDRTIIVRFCVADAPFFRGQSYDSVEWRSRRYAVKNTLDSSQFGAGFMRCVCVDEGDEYGSY